MKTRKKNKENTDRDRREIVIDVLAQTIFEILKRQSLEGRDANR